MKNYTNIIQTNIRIRKYLNIQMFAKLWPRITQIEKDQKKTKNEDLSSKCFETTVFCEEQSINLQKRRLYK